MKAFHFDRFAQLGCSVSVSELHMKISNSFLCEKFRPCLASAFEREQLSEIGLVLIGEAFRGDDIQKTYPIRTFRESVHEPISRIRRKLVQASTS